MRGDALEPDAMFSYISPAQRVPPEHPLRVVRRLTDAALARLSPEFEKLYSSIGRPSVPPERLLRASLLQYFYGIRSERLLMEQLDYNLLFRWFVGLNMDDPIWDASTFSKNRERLLEGDVARAFFDQVLAQARERGLLSDEHFTVDGTRLVYVQKPNVGSDWDFTGGQIFTRTFDATTTTFGPEQLLVSDANYDMTNGITRGNCVAGGVDGDEATLVDSGRSLDRVALERTVPGGRIAVCSKSSHVFFSFLSRVRCPGTTSSP